MIGSMSSIYEVAKKLHNLSAGKKFLITLIPLAILLVVFTIFQTIDDFYLSDSLSVTMMFREPFQLHSVFAMDYHTFLFKLPFFYIEQKIGLSILSHTILSLMFTVPMFGCFGYIFYKITKRYRYTALLLTGLMMLFLLIPPHYTLNNMTMPSMRNIEYGMFFLAFYWLYRDDRRSRRCIGLLFLVLLVASDPMFAPYAIGASLLVAIFTNFRNVTKLVKMRSIYTFGISVLSSALGMILLRLASVVGLVVVGKESGAMFIKQPVESITRAVEFFVDALKSILVSLGIDVARAPIYRPETIIAIIVASTVSIMGIVALRKTLKQSTDTYSWREQYVMLAIATVIATIVPYTLTQHVADGGNVRFFHIALFSLSIVASYGLAVLKPQVKGIVITAFILAFTVCSLSGISRAYHYASFTERTTGSLHDNIAKRLKEHNINTIAGDYWHIYPISARARSNSDQDLRLLPLSQRCASLQAYFIDARWMSYKNIGPYFAVVAYTQPVGDDYDYNDPMSTACIHKDAVAQFGQPLKRVVVDPIPQSGLRPYHIYIYPTEKLSRINTDRARAKLNESYRF